jgi:hypothetical protein
MTTLPNCSSRYHRLDVGVVNDADNYVWPQVENMGEDYRWDDPGSVTALTANRPLNVVPNLRSFHLHDATAITDLISQAYITATGLLASTDFCATISGHVIQAHQAFAAEVVFRGRSFAYTWLHLTEQIDERIDYANSTFITRRFDRTEELTAISDRAAWRRKTAELVNTMTGSLLARTIAFLPGTPRFELFALDLPEASFFVSAGLGDELRSSGLTGFEILPANTEVLFE